MGCPLLVVCCCGRVSAECFGTCQPLGRRGAPLSHCRVGSVGCAGIWQLCDEVRTVWCRSRFVLLAQQAISSLMRICWAPPARFLERRRGLSHASEESSHRPLGAWTNDGIFHPLEIGSMAKWQPRRGAIAPSLPHRCGKDIY